MFLRTLKHGSLALSVVALAAVFTTAPAVVGYGPMDAAAHAKSENGKGGNGGKGQGATKSASAKTKIRGGGGGGGGSSKGRSGGFLSDVDRAIGRALGTEKKSTRPAKGGSQKAVEEVEVVTLEEPLEPLKANQKGKWNAANANQRALDVHIRNEKWNGTIGALSLYQLTGKAAAGVPLNENEQRALDNLLGDYGPEFTNGELADVLNGLEEGDVVWGYDADGAYCIENCGDLSDEDISDANQAVADYLADQEMEARDEAIQDLWASSQQRIIDDSNKPTEGIEDQLLDELAHDLGFERFDPDAEEIDPETGEEIVILPEDEVIVITE